MTAVDSTPIIRPLARVLEVRDADSYLMLLDLHGRGLTENGCVSEWIRLRDYSARELSDTAPEDPLGYGRVDGPAAKNIAASLLANRAQIVVELKGPEGTGSQSFARYLGWIWVDGQSLGELLVAQHAAVAGKFEGLTPTI